MTPDIPAPATRAQLLQLLIALTTDARITTGTKRSKFVRIPASIIPLAQEIMRRETLSLRAGGHPDLAGMMELIFFLRDEEADNVNILCDNPEGDPNNAVECCGFWTGFAERRFAGESLIAALTAAAEAKRQAQADGYPPIG